MYVGPSIRTWAATTRGSPVFPRQIYAQQIKIGTVRIFMGAMGNGKSFNTPPLQDDEHMQAAIYWT
jgi:hypothetical protein